LPSSVDLALAALIEPLACAIHAYDLLPRLLGAHYLIYGAGTMGLIMAQLAPRAGAVSVSVVDPQPQRQQAARDVGIDLVASSPDEVARPGGWATVIDWNGGGKAGREGLRRGGGGGA